MTSTHAGWTHAATTPTADPDERRTSTVTELRAMADQLGQMEVGDPRWSYLEPVLDVCLLSAVANADDGPRTTTWHAIATDVDTPLIVKLRTLGIALQEPRRR